MMAPGQQHEHLKDSNRETSARAKDFIVFVYFLVT